MAAVLGIPSSSLCLGLEKPSCQLCRHQVLCHWERLPGCWLRGRSHRRTVKEERRAGTALEKGSGFRASQSMESDGEE